MNIIVTMLFVLSVGTAIIALIQRSRISDLKIALESWRNSYNDVECKQTDKDSKHLKAVRQFKMQIAALEGEIAHLEKIDIDDATELMQNFDDEGEKESFMRAYLGGETSGGI